MTAELREIITSIKDKAARLQAACENEKRKNYELTNKIQTLENENSELTEKIQKLSQELETIKLSKTLTNKETKEETKGQINTLIRDIDNCIALINKM